MFSTRHYYTQIARSPLTFNILINQNKLNHIKKLKKPSLCNIQCSSMITTDSDKLFIQSGHMMSTKVSDFLNHRPIIKTAPPIAYEVIKGAQVKDDNGHLGIDPRVPTAVFIHGIFGSRKNLYSFSKDLLKEFPEWQALLVDLRCHGDSALNHFHGTHDVNSAARDILQLLNYLKLFPKVLVGHSFGGKVIMSMAQQFGNTLPRPVEAWVLDSLPGHMNLYDYNNLDNPYDLINALKKLPLPILNRSILVNQLENEGFSPSISRWMTTNLRPINGQSSNNLTWKFDLDGIEKMFNSYVMSSFWRLLESPPEGLKLNFIRAENSHFPWNKNQNKERITSLGHNLYTLENSGHWLHTDNPTGLLQIFKNHFYT